MLIPIALALLASASEAPEVPVEETPDLFGAETQPTDPPVDPPADPIVPEVTIQPAPPKKRRKHRKVRGAAPDVGPPPPNDGPAPMFDGAPPSDPPIFDADEVREEREEPAAAPTKASKRKKPIDPRKTAAKAAQALDGLSVFVATRRYGNLMMTIPGTNEQIPIAALAAAPPAEREEVEAALVDVIEELAITLTSTQAAALAIFAVYGKRWWSMEQTANALHGHLKGKGTAV